MNQSYSVDFNGEHANTLGNTGQPFLQQSAELFASLVIVYVLGGDAMPHRTLPMERNVFLLCQGLSTKTSETFGNGIASSRLLAQCSVTWPDRKKMVVPSPQKRDKKSEVTQF